MPTSTLPLRQFPSDLTRRPLNGRRSRINYKYKYRRASCRLAYEEPCSSPYGFLKFSHDMEDGMSVSSTSGSAGPGSSSASSSVAEEVVLRINVPELKVEKCLQFHKDDLVWDVKQQALASLPKVALWFRELKESFNYGLFCPPQNGRAGKFLDEERPLADYPFSSAVGYLELKYKRRVYKMLNLEEKSLRALHTKANLRRFTEFVKENNVEKISKLCAKGMDPNFHCFDSGETPLTLAARIRKPGRLLLALVNGGGLLDYRTKEGLTAMHRAVQSDNSEAVRTLLDLGASPNYKDIRGLTPLYYSVTHSTDPMLCEALLYDYAVIGATDNQGWQEIHQTCRNKLTQHLEHLLFYGADMNCQNASGNTPLHVCAVNNLEDCARILLFRGCDKNALNYANQTPYQVAVIAGNLELAEIIKNHSNEDVVPFREPPKYNPKRRISGAPLSRTHSDPRLEGCQTSTKPPSPSPSNRSIPPFSSASSLSEASTGSGSTCTHPSEADSEEGGSSALGSAAGGEVDIVSDSSGVCTSNSGESCDSTVGASPAILAESVHFDPGMLVVCLKQYSSTLPGHLSINPGDILEVVGSSDDGMLEGCVRGVTGVFPAHCVQEVRLRNPQAIRESVIASQMTRVVNRNEEHKGIMRQQLYGTTPRTRKSGSELRTVVLHKGKKGFGFVLRGAKATSPLMERPGEKGSALQYLDDVDPGGVADLAGLKKGDYLLKINGEDVSQASHEHVVNLIRKSGDLVQMTVQSSLPAIFLPPKPPIGNLVLLGRGHQTLPRKFPQARQVHAPTPPPRDPKTTLSVGRARARSMVAGLQEVESLEYCMREHEQNAMSQSAYATLEPRSPERVHYSSGMKVASIKNRPTSKRMTATEVESFISYNGNSLPSSPSDTPNGKAPKAQKVRTTPEGVKIHKDFHSTPDLQGIVLLPLEQELTTEEKHRSRSQEDLFITAPSARHSIAIHHATAMEYREYENLINADNLSSGIRPLKRSQSAANASQLKKGVRPPPSHPPPPVPQSQVVKVDVCHTKSDYAAVTVSPVDPPASSVKSSFRPTDSAKLYASPEEIKTVGYKSPDSLGGTMPRKCNGNGNNSKTRSQSLPPTTSRPNISKVSSENDTSVDSGIYSATYSTFRNTDTVSTAFQSKDSEIVKYARPKTVTSQSTNADGNKCPNIPEPDYSSDENSEILNELPVKKTKTKKKKQTVMFASNVVSSPDDIECLTTTNLAGKPPPAPLSSNVFKEQIAKKAAERQARQDSSLGSAPSSANSSPNKKGNGSNSKALSEAIQESILFNRQKDKANGTCNDESLKDLEELRNEIKTSSSCSNEFIVEDGENSSSGVSSDQDFHQERNYVTVINTESNAIGSKGSKNKIRDDSSEASESSDEASDRTWILRNEKAESSDSGKECESNGSRRTSTLTKNAVSLAKLPPPQESHEPEEFRINSEQLARLVDQDTISTGSSFSSTSSVSGGSSERDTNQFLNYKNIYDSSHTVQKNVSTSYTLPRLGLSVNSSSKIPAAFVPSHTAYNSVESIRGKPSPAKTNSWNRHNRGDNREKFICMSQSATLDRNFFNSCRSSTNVDTGEVEYERSIEESLQLIRMHMDSLNEVNDLAGIPGERPTGSEFVLAPPPEFSDMSQSNQQSGLVPNRPDFKNKTVIHISHDEPDLPVRILKKKHHHHQLTLESLSFRQKPLNIWSTKDTTDWLESIFMPEYKDTFIEQQIDGSKLMYLDNETLINLGVRRVGHRVNMEKSLRRYRPIERIDL